MLAAAVFLESFVLERISLHIDVEQFINGTTRTFSVFLGSKWLVVHIFHAVGYFFDEFLAIFPKLGCVGEEGQQWCCCWHFSFVDCDCKISSALRLSSKQGLTGSHRKH